MVQLCHANWQTSSNDYLDYTKAIEVAQYLIAREGADVVITRGSTFDNRANLSEAFFNSVVSQYAGHAQGPARDNAEVLTEIEGALWNIAQLDELRRRRCAGHEAGCCRD